MCATSCFLLVAAITGANPDRDFLSARAKDIVDSEGSVVAMRGVNFGGWLMMETWIPSIAQAPETHLRSLAAELGIEKDLDAARNSVGAFNDDVMKFPDYLERLLKAVGKKVGKDKDAAFRERLKKEPPIVDAVTLDRVWRMRFGDGGAQELWDAFHNTWYTQEEFNRAKAVGFTFARIPFWYRWFEDDAAPCKYRDYGFTYLDRAIAWAKANGMYVLLDMHGAPGGQNPWEHTGEISRGELFADEECQKRTCALWKAIAARYKNEPAIFCYGCLNEPFSAKGVEDWSRVHDGIYKAIRSTGDRHIIMMEDGYKLEENPWREKGFFPKPDSMGWENVIYSIHFYHTPDEKDYKKVGDQVIRIGTMEQDRTDVPIYMGEFNSLLEDRNAAIEAMAYFFDRFNAKGWAWSPWTFKFTGPGRKTLWGVYQYAGDWTTPNVHRDSKESLLDAIAKLKAENFTPIEPYAEILRKYLNAPTVSAGTAPKTSTKTN